MLALLLSCTGPTDTASAPVDETAVEPAALSVSPSALEFGDLPRGCVSAAQSITISNTGGTALAVTDAVVEGNGSSAFAAVLPDGPVDGGSSATLAVSFAPTALYDYALPLTVTTDAGSATVQLSGSGVAGTAITDTATVALNDAVDVLLLVDHTESMAEPLAAIETAMGDFWAALTGEGASVRLGVLTMDLEDANHSGAMQAILNESSAAPALPAPTSTATETGLAALIAALSEPLLSGANADFRRDEVPLSVVVFSDEDDDSDLNETEVASWVADQGLTLHAMVEARKPDGDCQTEPGGHYLDLMAATGGRFVSICEPDPAADLADIALDILGLSPTFALSAAPDSASGVTVTRNGEAVPQDLTDGWTLDTTDSTVTLHGAYAPQVGDTFTFDYTASDCP